jgi:sulfur transfer protein SufE
MQSSLIKFKIFEQNGSWEDIYKHLIQMTVILNRVDQSRLESTTEIMQNKHVKVLHYFVDDIK